MDNIPQELRDQVFEYLPLYVQPSVLACVSTSLRDRIKKITNIVNASINRMPDWIASNDFRGHGYTLKGKTWKTGLDGYDSLITDDHNWIVTKRGSGDIEDGNIPDAYDVVTTVMCILDEQDVENTLLGISVVREQVLRQLFHVSYSMPCIQEHFWLSINLCMIESEGYEAIISEYERLDMMNYHKDEEGVWEKIRILSDESQVMLEEIESAMWDVIACRL